MFSRLATLTVTEGKLLLREPATWITAVVLPSALLAVLASIPALRDPDPLYDGLRFIDVWAPSLVAMIVTTLGLQSVPPTLASYREKGVLRRLGTTRVGPLNLLVAQLLVNLLAAEVEARRWSKTALRFSSNTTPRARARQTGVRPAAAHDYRQVQRSSPYGDD